MAAASFLDARIKSGHDEEEGAMLPLSGGKELRAMTADTLIVTHRIALRGADTAAVVAALTGREGVQRVSADADGRHLHVTYDLSHLRRDAIEAAIDRAGGRPAKGIVAALARGWARFTEDNVLASVKRPYSSCCNRPPK